MRAALLALCLALARADTPAPPAPPARGSAAAAELWRLPGLDADVYPAPASLANFSAALTARGFRPTGSRAQALASHRSHNVTNFTHVAIHEGVGFVSLNYTAALRKSVVSLDEFAPLFARLNATWACNATGALGPNITQSTLTFARVPAGVRQIAAHVLAYLVRRLGAPNATLVWGPRLLRLAEAKPLWDASCNDAFSARYTAPYFFVNGRFENGRG